MIHVTKKYITKISLSICALCILTVLNMSPVHAQSQQSAGLTGIVLDSVTGKKIQGVSVAVFSATENELVTGMITDQGGSFLFEELITEEYTLRLSYIGYETKLIDVFDLAANAELNLGEIQLDRSQEQMDVVEVEAQRESITFERDRTSYRTEDMVSSSGASVIELLDEIASIEVDVHGNISYRGNQNVVIHINNRPTSLQRDALTSYLRSIPSDFIERIETIPNPSARYDPEGIGGIINIVLRDEKGIGLSGRIAASASTLGQFRPNVAGGYHREPWNIFASYAFSVSNYNFSSIEQREQFGANPYHLDRNMDTDYDVLNHVFDISGDYSISNSSTIILNNQFGLFGNDQETMSINRFTNSSIGTPDYDARSLYDRSGTFVNNKLVFERDLSGDEQKMSVEGSHEYMGFDYDSSLSQLFRESSSEDQISFRHLDGNWREFKLNLHYENLFAERIQLESGIESRRRTIIRNLEGEDNASEWGYDLDTHSAYTTLGGSLSSIDLEAGVRIEQAYTDLENRNSLYTEAFTGDYFNFFPSASIGYNLNAGKQVSLSYSKRINRPGIGSLITNMDVDDPLVRRIGNPELEPEFTHSFELSYSQFGQGYMFSIQPYFRRTTNVIRREVTVDDEGVTYYSMRNLSWQNNYGTELNNSITFKEKLRINGALNLYMTDIDGANVDSNLESGAFAWSTNINISYTFEFGLMAQFMGSYRSPIDVEYGEVGSRKNVNFTLRQPLMSDRLQLSAQFRDVLGTMGSSYYYQTDQFNHLNNTENNIRSINFSISYSFGSRDLPETRSGQPMM